jgi:hypothetical protein
MRRLQSTAAAEALQRARHAAAASGIPALQAEVESAAQMLRAPVARLVAGGAERIMTLAEVESLHATGALIVDACRCELRLPAGAASQRHKTGARAEGAARKSAAPSAQPATAVRLGGRPVLFALARLLAEAWPADVSRSALVAGAFRAREADESYRARLRVEIGRLRGEIRALADIQATKDGFQLIVHGARPVAVLAPLDESRNGELLALLSDGESWSSSALAIALDASARTVQRALEPLIAAGKVHCFGRGPARRYMLPSVPGFPSTLLLPIAGRIG